MNNKKILVVEDEKAIAHTLGLKLANAGINGKFAHDGEQAISELKKNKYDLVILDIILPKLDGFSVLDRINQYHKKTPVFVYSNLDEEEDAARARSMGAKEYYSKTRVSLSELVNDIKNFLK